MSIHPTEKMRQIATIPIVILPDVLADMKKLPFRENLFDIVIFDPPHLDSGLESFLAKKWGSWTRSETIQTLRIVNEEFFRVLKPHGNLILKVLPRMFLIYETLLKNFSFFLPIYTYRSRGFLTPSLQKRPGALWAVGSCNGHRKEEIVVENPSHS